MLTVQDIKNKRIKGAWKGKIGEPKPEKIIKKNLRIDLLEAIKNKNFDQTEKSFKAGAYLKQEDKQFLSEVMKTYTPEEEAKFDLLCSKKYN